MPNIDYNEKRVGVKKSGETLADAIRLADDFGSDIRVVAVIRGIRVAETYDGPSLRDLAKGRLMASSYRPLATDFVDGVMLVFMPPITQR